MSVESIGGFPAALAAPGADTESGDIGIDALVGASYASYQISQDLWVGMAINSPFGLATKPEDINYAGSVLGRTTKLLTINANPTVAYKLAPGHHRRRWRADRMGARQAAVRLRRAGGSHDAVQGR